MKEKSKSLRPLRVALAVLAVIVVVLILDRVPIHRTYSSTEKTSPAETLKTVETSGSEEGFYYFSGLLELLEDSLEKRLSDLGVPEEEYKNIGDYLSKDEIFEIETKATLAAELEEVWARATSEDLVSLRNIFGLEESYTFSELAEDSTPSEYKNLADLIENYRSTLTNTEDYDIIENT